MTINYITVGKRIRRLRTAQRITQEELAFRIGTSAAFISNIELAKKKPSLQKLSQIADALDVTVNDLLYNTPPSESDFSGNELSRILDLCPPEKQQKLMEHLAAIIKSFTTH